MRKQSALLATAALTIMASALPVMQPATSGGAEAKPSSEQRAEQSKRQNEQRGTSSTERAFLGGYGSNGRSRQGYPRPGWSVAHGKRLARKAKNKARNRRAHRG